MHLRHASILAIVLTGAVFLLGHMFLTEMLVVRGFDDLERDHVLHAARAAGDSFQNAQKQLDRFLWDWTSWDDAYAFVQGDAPEFVASNLPLSTFTDQDLNAIIFWDHDGDVLYARGVTPDGGGDPALANLLIERCGGELPDLPGEETGQGGVIADGPGSLVLVARRPILTSEDKGPAMGRMLMARRVTDEFLEDLAGTLGFPVHLATTAGGHPTANQARLDLRVVDDNTIQGQALVTDIAGLPVARLRIDLDRDIHRHGQWMARYGKVVVALVIVAYSLVIFLLLHRKVLSRLERLSRQVKGLGGRDEGMPRVDMDGHDEIKALADTMNAMLASMEASRKEIRDQGRELEENVQFLSQIFSTVRAGILMVDPLTMTIVEINDFALDMAGRRREEVVGHVCHKLTCPADKGQCPIIDLHQSHDFSKRRLIKSDGSQIPIMKSVAYVERKGRRLLLETFIDITLIEESRIALEQAKDDLEAKVAERTYELEQANRELVTLDKVKSLFLSSASHELRTPLTSIIGFLKLMQRNYRELFLPRLASDPKLERKAKAFGDNLDVVKSESERLSRLVNDLLDLNRIESGRMEWRDEWLDPRQTLEQAMDIIAGYTMENGGVELRMEADPHLPQLHVDKDRIHQVLFNLLHNALKFTTQGTVVLRAECSPEGVAFSVEDSGTGIPEEDRGMIFDLFYQAQDGDNRSTKELGTGLGLAICRQIVQHYGGDIAVTSVLGEGSCFRFTIPTQQACGENN